MLDALKRFHNAQEMLDEQEDISTDTTSRIMNLKAILTSIGTDFSTAAVKEINDRVDELIVHSQVLSRSESTVSLSPHALKALGFKHTNLVAEEFGIMPGWCKEQIYLFEMIEGWIIGVGAPAKLLKEAPVETVYDLNQYHQKSKGIDLISLD